MDPIYQDPRLVELYDSLNAWGPDNDFYLQRLAAPGRSVLDLGCGTGLLACAAARHGCQVVGVDPAAPMLALARQRDEGLDVAWIEADACTLRLNRRFDRVIATGHVFQVFLTEQDQQAFFSTVAAHLAPEGELIFETRNPAVEPWRGWTPDASRRRIVHPKYGEIEVYHQVSSVAGAIVQFITTFHFLDDGGALRSESRLRFTDVSIIRTGLQQAGLTIKALYGSWNGTPYHPGCLEIIVVAEQKQGLFS